MSCNAREALKNAQHSGAAKQLIQQVDTRWNSHFDMFERILELFVLSQLDMQSILKKGLDINRSLCGSFPTHEGYNSDDERGKVSHSLYVYTRCIGNNF